MPDAHKNFAYSTVATAPSPADTGTSLVVQAGDGAKFPTPPFNVTVWPIGDQPLTTNAEIVRVTAISGDTLTIARTQEGTTARTILVGDQIAATITAKTLTDAEGVGSELSCRLILSSSPLLSSDTWVTVTWTAEDYDVGGLHDLVTNPSRITVPTGGAGRYSLKASAIFTEENTHRVKVRKTAAQSIGNNAWTAVSFDSEDYDEVNLHDTVTNNTRLTSQRKGKFHITGNAHFAANATGQRGVRIVLNGATVLETVLVDAAAAGDTILEVSVDHGFAAITDYVELQVFQNSGGNLNVTNDQTRFMMYRLEDAIRGVRFKKNGATLYAQSVLRGVGYPIINADYSGVISTVDLSLADGDYIEVEVYHNFGLSRHLRAESRGAFFSAARIR